MRRDLTSAPPHSMARARLVAAAVTALGPLVVVLLLRLPLINQLDYADAWFYSAYAWVPEHHFGLFDWNYFSVRFPAIVSINVFEQILGTHGGYVVLRYLLAVASGLALYACVRRFSTPAIATGATALLYLHPFFSRMLLWDYASFIAVSLGVVGLSLWWWSEGRAPVWTFLPGVALSIALYANAIVATALAVLLVVELVAAVRTGRQAVRLLAARLGIAAGSSVLVLGVGWLSYLRFTSVTPDDLLRPTLRYLLSNEENSTPYVRPISEWLPHELRIWAPVVLSVALVAVLRRDIFGIGLPARVAQACVGYTVFLWVYRFAVTSSVVETWWAYDLAIIVMAPGFGVLLHALANRRSGMSIACLPVGVSAASAFVIRRAQGPAENLYGEASQEPWLLLVITTLALGLAVLVGLSRSSASVVALVGLTLISTLVAWAPSVLDSRGTTGLFARDSDLEWDTYGGGKALIELIQDFDSRESRVYTWYPDTLGPESIGWTTLPHLGSTVHLLGVPASMSRLEPLGRARLLQRDAAYVLALSERADDVSDARRALSAAGFTGRLVRSGMLADDRLRYALIALVHKPAG